MRKAIKKVTVMVGLVSMMALSLTGCKKKTECEMCGETKSCYKYEITYDGDSESGYLCDDCADTMKSLTELAGGKFKKK